MRGTLEDDTLALVLPGAVDARRCADWARAALEARDAWVSDFGGQQFSLGRAWYTHLEQGRTGEYFAGAEASDALVDATCPGLQAVMRALVARRLEGAVAPRAGWCGPGVHVFPPEAHVSRKGGDIHFDTEGLTKAHLAAREHAYTCVLMLSPPASGGGLRLWDVTYDGSEGYEDEDLERESETFVLAAGDAILFDSYRLHQIQPFGGEEPRVTATIHAAWVGGEWETWF